MIPRDGRWADLYVGSYIKDKNGATWKITSEVVGEFVIVNREGVAKALKPRAPDTPVTIMVPTPMPEETLLISELGASVMARRHNGADAWACAPWEDMDVSQQIAHLHSFHRVVYEDGEVGTLDADHNAGPHVGHTPHHHQGVS